MPKWDSAIIFGGDIPNGRSNQVYRLTGLNSQAPEWKLVPTTGAPTPRWGSGMSYDPKTDRLIIVGGALGGSAPCVSETWILTNASGMAGTPSNWLRLSTAGATLPVRFLHSQVYDEVNNRLIVWGGNDCFRALYDDLWVLTNANGLGGTPTWMRLFPNSITPHGRLGHSAVYDQEHNKMIVFGGTGGMSFNDVWVLHNANGLGGTPTWTRLSPLGQYPEPRAAHRAVYDAKTNEMIIYGGHDTTSFPKLWRLTNANGLEASTSVWSQLVVGGTEPPPRSGHGMVFDPITKNIIVMGGTNAGTGNYYNDLRILRRKGYVPFGFNFSPYVDGQDPNLQPVISEQQISNRMKLIAASTRWVRTFGCTSGLEKTGKIAHSLGLYAALGAWIGDDPNANERELANLIKAANAGEVDMAIVGSEVLLRKDNGGGKITEADLLAYIRRVRAQIPAHIPVTTGETYGALLNHKPVIDAVDLVYANIYPYWEGISIEGAICATDEKYNLLKKQVGTKPIYISEAGWPSAGNPLQNAVPTSGNASRYFLEFTSWARTNNINTFYFSALDETWKERYEGPQGAHWGVYDKDGRLKAGMERVFNGDLVTLNCNPLLCGLATPSITADYIVPIGQNGTISGRVCGVKAQDYVIVTYLKVGSLWWVKPYANAPQTKITSDGRFEVPITTGGQDTQGTDVALFLTPRSYAPPILLGAATLPAELTKDAAATLMVKRPAN